MKNIKISVIVLCGTMLVGMAVAPKCGYAQQTSDRRYFNLPDKPVQAPFSDGVLVGNTLYLSGRLGLDPKTGKAPDSVEAEIRLLLDGVRAALGAGNMTMNDLVYVQIFCPDLGLYNAFNTIYRTYFEKDFPARAFIGCASLLRGCHFEMQCIAIKRG